MPRDLNGNYSLPNGTIVASGDTILPSQHNPFANDVAQSITNSLSRDGLGGMRATLDMGTYGITNAGLISGSSLAITGAFGLGGSATITGNTTVGGILSGGSIVSGSTIAAAGTIAAGGTISGPAFVSTGTISATGNITSGGVVTGSAVSASASGVGVASMVSGDATHSGYLGLYNANGAVRVGRIGFMLTTAGAQDLNYENDTAGRHNFREQVVAPQFNIDGTAFTLYRLSGDPIINLSAGTYFRFDETTRQLFFHIDNVVVMRIDPTTGNALFKGIVTPNAPI